MNLPGKRVPQLGCHNQKVPVPGCPLPNLRGRQTEVGLLSMTTVVKFLWEQAVFQYASLIPYNALKVKNSTLLFAQEQIGS